MKKIFTLTVILFAMMFANAQYLLQEGFEGTDIPTGWTVIDNDGDGNNWYVLNNSQSSGGGFNVHSGDGHITSASWASAALTPDNWLITPVINLTSNATLTFWVAGQDASWAAEHFSVYLSTTGTAVANFTNTLLYDQVSTATMTQYTVDLSQYTGQSVYIAFRHHNITDMFRLNLDDVEVFVQPTSATITAAPSSIDFGDAILSDTVTRTVTVTNYMLTSDVTATTAAPFSVSADGITFGTTATIDTAGGTLYVRYIPATAGIETGNVTLSATGATNVTIALTGNAIDCSGATIPYVGDFSNATQMFCWDIVDANNDGNTFTIDGIYAMYSYSTTEDADDWLISPAFNLTGNQIATIDYGAESANYPERFQVFAINGTQQIALTAPIDVDNVADQTLAIDLTSLNGSYRIGFHCISDADQYNFYLSNFTVSNISGTELSADPTAIDFTSVEINTTTPAQEVVIYSLNLNAPITVSVPAPYQVSLDGTTFSTSVTIPANSDMVVYDQVYVRFAPTIVGTYSQNMTISANGMQEIVALMGTAADCSTGISNFPYNYDFNTGIYPPICWSADDPENFTRVNNADEGDYGLVFLDAAKLFTPEIHSEHQLRVTFDYACYVGSEYEVSTTFRVGYSSTNTDPSSFTWGTPAISEETEYIPYTMTVPAGTKYIAIEVTDMEVYFYYPNYLFIDNFSIDEIVGVENHEAENAVTLFPNPAKDVLNINANSNIENVQVYNMMGQVVSSYNVNDVNTQINTSSFANGVYTVKIATENGTTTQKFTVAR